MALTVLDTTPAAVASSGMPTAVELATNLAQSTPIRSSSISGVALPSVAALDKFSIAFGDNGSVVAPQGERLFTARPRSAPSKATSQTDVWRDSTKSRGQHAYIKLLTANASQAASYAQNRGAVGDGYAAKLTGEGSHVARMVSNDSASGYDSFLITSVSCSLSEKMQVTEVFGDNEVVYYFGRQPIMFNISGVIVDSRDNEWFTDWLGMYSAVMRGSQLAQRNQLLRLVLPNMILTGTISSTSWTQDSSSDVSIPFNFSFLAKRVEPLAVSESDKMAQNLIDFSKAEGFVTQQQITSLKSSLDSLTKAVKNPATTIAQLGSAMYSSAVTATTSLFQTPSAVQGAINSLKGIQSSVENFANNNSFSSWLSGKASLFSSGSAALNGLRMQLFSPIYGVLTSLTKLVKRTFGDITSIFKSLMSPVQNILRDITNISNQAIGLVNLVNGSIRGLGRMVQSEIGSTKQQFKLAMKSLGKAAGSIATSPITVLQSTQAMFKSGGFNANTGALPAFLMENKRASLSSATLVGGAKGPAYKVALLQGSPSYSASKGATL